MSPCAHRQREPGHPTSSPTLGAVRALGRGRGRSDSCAVGAQGGVTSCFPTTCNVAPLFVGLAAASISLDELLVKVFARFLTVDVQGSRMLHSDRGPLL